MWRLQGTVDLLAEGRQHGFELSRASQSLRQVRDPTHLFDTAGTVPAFRSGPAETAVLSHEFATLDDGTLWWLPPYMVALRTPIRELGAMEPAPTSTHQRRPFPSLFDRANGGSSVRSAATPAP